MTNAVVERGTDGQNLTNTAWSFATVRMRDAPLLEVLASAAVCKMRQRQEEVAMPQELANMAWAFAKLSYRIAPLWNAISAAALLTMSEFSAPNLSITAWSFASCMVSDCPLMAAIAAPAITKIVDFQQQHLANIAWSFATMTIEHCPLMAVIAAAAIPPMSQFNQQHLANTAWSFAVLCVEDGPLMDAIAAQSISIISEFAVQGIANLAWALAKLLYRNDPLLNAIAAPALKQLLYARWEPQNLSNTVWAVASVRFLNMPLSDAISRAAVANIHEFDSQARTNTVWSFAKLLIDDRPLMHAMSAEALRKLPQLNPQALSNTAWSCATLGFYSQPLMDAISSAAMLSISNFDGQGLSNIAWSYAALYLRNEPLIEAIASSALRSISKFDSTQNLSNLAWALAQMSVKHMPLLEALAGESVRRIGEFASQQLANTAWSLACLGELNAPLSDAIASAALRLVADFSPKGTLSDIRFGVDLRGLGWAFGFAGRLVEPLSSQLYVAHLEIGEALDGASGPPVSHTHTHPSVEHAVHAALGVTSSIAASSPAALDPGGSLPQIVFERPEDGIAAFFKPPGWEVDDDGKPPTGRRLSSFLQQSFPSSTVVRDGDHAFGMIHRLDLPSSGLILMGATYRGYYHLKWLLDTGRISREYVVLCHGWICPTLTEVDAPVHHISDKHAAQKTLTHQQRLGRSTVTEMGKPAQTFIRVLAHVRRGPWKLSLIICRIRTGRRHQIRTHLHHVGHPTVADGKYTRAQIFASDSRWCPRNFLHRQRLAFVDIAGKEHAVVEPLPGDLLAALCEVEVWGPSVVGARALAEWTDRGAEPRAWADYLALPVGEAAAPAGAPPHWAGLGQPAGSGRLSPSRGAKVEDLA
mmetsp:Transcript_28017/g.93089  ORF Transcript_28017/g.93089 Transcript_28017/m.93089 type:complete len:870 (-) Transcript_28017:67-2676(-)